MSLSFVWPDQESVEIPSRRAESWAVVPSRCAHAAVLTLPPHVLRKMSNPQLAAMILDRLPVDSEDALIWAVCLPRPFWFRKFETVFACAASRRALAAQGFAVDEPLIPEDMALAAGAFQRKAPPVLAIDAPGVLTLFGRSARGRAVNVVKRFYAEAETAQEQLEDDLRLLSAQVNPSALVLPAGGKMRASIERLHEVRTEETREFIARNLARILNHPSRWSWMRSPEPASSVADESDESSPARPILSRVAPVFRRVLLAAALAVPVIALVYGGKHAQSRQILLTAQMRAIYQQRFGADVDYPVRALEAKAKQMGRRPRGMPVQSWIGMLDEISRSARQKNIKLDDTRLAAQQLDLAGRIENAGGLQEWIDGLKSQAGVEDAFLLKSENDLKSKSTRFMVRIRIGASQ